MTCNIHKQWIKSLYIQYKKKDIPTLDDEVDTEEVLYRNVPNTTTFFEHNILKALKESDFEKEWLKIYPPLLQRQHAKLF